MLFYLPKEDTFPNVRHVGFTKKLKEWQHFERVSDEYILYIVTDGTLYLQEEHIQYSINAGNYFILEPNKKHFGYKSSKCQYYYYHFNVNTKFGIIENEEERISQFVENRKNSIMSDPFLPMEHPNDTDIVLPKHFHVSDMSKIINIANMTYNAICDYYSKYENYRLIVSATTLQVLIILSREFVSSIFDENNLHGNKMLFNMQKLTDYINSNYQKTLNKDTIEEFMNLNYDYLNQLFKKYYNTTIGIFIQNTRINAAKKLITETDLSYSEIAYLVGINDPYYFSKLFKKLTGLSPSRYSEITKFEHYI